MTENFMYALELKQFSCSQQNSVNNVTMSPTSNHGLFWRYWRCVARSSYWNINYIDYIPLIYYRDKQYTPRILMCFGRFYYMHVYVREKWMLIWGDICTFFLILAIFFVLLLFQCQWLELLYVDMKQQVSRLNRRHVPCRRIPQWCPPEVSVGSRTL